MPTINEALNLVVPARSDDKGVLIYAYHSPISREVFEANYRLLAATKSALAGKGVFYMMDAGPRIASLAFRDEGRRDALERGDVDAKGNPNEDHIQAFMAEIKRLTTILAPTSGGFQPIPVDAAIAQNLIDDEEWLEAESAIIFFTFNYWLSRKAIRGRQASATASVLKASVTSLSAMEFTASLQTSIQAETTSEKVASSGPC
jgi:hypothetical protein